MDFQSSVLLVATFIAGWLIGGFILMAPVIVRHVRQRRRQQQWLRLVSGQANVADRRDGDDKPRSRH
jgi:hypothetical protein